MFSLAYVVKIKIVDQYYLNEAEFDNDLRFQRDN
jgi:hypothetical protein